MGQGDKNVAVRFGAGTGVPVEILEKTIEILRTALGDPAADTRMVVRAIAFASGHDLTSFAQDYGIELSAADVEQQ